MTSAAIVSVRQAHSGALTAPLVLLLAIASGLAVGNGLVWTAVQRRRAIARLSRMDHHDLKDLGFPTRLQMIGERAEDGV